MVSEAAGVEGWEAGGKGWELGAVTGVLTGGEGAGLAVICETASDFKLAATVLRSSEAVFSP